SYRRELWREFSLPALVRDHVKGTAASAVALLVVFLASGEFVNSTAGQLLVLAGSALVLGSYVVLREVVYSAPARLLRKRDENHRVAVEKLATELAAAKADLALHEATPRPYLKVGEPERMGRVFRRPPSEQ